METLPDLISILPGWFQYVLAALVIVATVSELTTRIAPIWNRPMARLWPDRTGWSANATPPDVDQRESEMLTADRAWQGGLGHRWSAMRQMRVGDYFELHLAKVRVICEIEALCIGDRDPLSFRLSIWPDENSKDWQTVGVYEHPMCVQLAGPTKMSGIRFEVVQPRIEPKDAFGRSPAWSIYDIRLTEVRLLGRWWRKVIAGASSI